MIRKLSLPVIALALLWGGASLHAQDAAPPPPSPPPAEGSDRPAPPFPPPGDTASEFRQLREILDRQTMQIEMLAREISQLRRKLDGGSTAAAQPTGGEPSATASSAPAPSESPAATASAPEIPRAEPTGGGVKHIVSKGETLTSIAKNYNIPVAVLQKANKIQDGRKLQIGQVLSVPQTPEPSSDKKETP